MSGQVHPETQAVAVVEKPTDMGEGAGYVEQVDEDGVVINPYLVACAGEAGIAPPRLINYFAREHVALAVLYPTPLYSNQRQPFSRNGRIFLLAFVFMIAFIGSMVYALLTKQLVSCSAAAFCLANCRSAHGVNASSPTGAVSGACESVPFNAQYSGDRGYQLYGFPPPNSPSQGYDAWSWCGGGELDPPVCVTYCKTSVFGDDDRPLCTGDGAGRSDWIMCVAPTSIQSCDKVGDPRSSQEREFDGLADSMRSDRKDTQNTTGKVLVYLFIALVVFFTTAVVKKIISCVTRSGRPCCIAFVVKILGTVIIIVLLIVIVILALFIHESQVAEQGHSFGDSLVLFSTSFGGSMVLEFVKLLFFYYVWPGGKRRYRAAYADELALLAQEWNMAYQDPMQATAEYLEA